MSNKKKISVVVSVYNEQQSLESFYSQARAVLEKIGWDYELIFVNDGSADKSPLILEGFAKENKKVRVINFSRNFGHEAAMIAGIDYAVGDGIVCMDADLQHPPECIPEIISKFEEGFEVISMVRTKNEDSGFFKKIAVSTFYKILNSLSDVKFEENASDFFAVTKSVAEVLRKDYREKVRYLRGYVQSVGFNKTTIEFEACKRFAGESKYSIKKLVKFALNALCSFSAAPVKIGLFAGGVLAVLGVVLGIIAVVMGIVQVTGAFFVGITAVLCLLFALVLFVLGIMGQYLSVMLEEIKGRPVYIVKDIISEDKREADSDK